MLWLCDRCMTPFNSYDCDPEVTPPGEDWTDLCPSCQDRRLKYMRLEAEDELEAAE